MPAFRTLGRHYIQRGIDPTPEPFNYDAMCSSFDERMRRGEIEILRDIERQRRDIGDAHANRICWVISFYCKIFRLNPKRLGWTPPGYHL